VVLTQAKINYKQNSNAKIPHLYFLAVSASVVVKMTQGQS